MSHWVGVSASPWPMQLGILFFALTLALAFFTLVPRQPKPVTTR